MGKYYPPCHWRGQITGKLSIHCKGCVLGPERPERPESTRLAATDTPDDFPIRPPPQGSECALLLSLHFPIPPLANHPSFHT